MSMRLLGLLHSWSLGTARCTPAVFSTKLKAGDSLRKERVFNTEEVVKYSQLSEDYNPIHLDADSAREAGFEGPIVHGMLTASLFSSLLAFHFPGAIYASQTLQFKNPLLMGKAVVAELHAVEIRELKKRYRVKFITKCLRKEDMAILVDGESVAVLPTLSYSSCSNNNA